MDDNYAGDNSQGETLGTVYFTGFALFIIASVVLSIGAFIALALAK